MKALMDMVASMHSVGITHSDLKDDNILWDADSQTFFPIDIVNHPYLTLKGMQKDWISSNDLDNWGALLKRIDSLTNERGLLR
jgi:serine/threonine protein kinase